MAEEKGWDKQFVIPSLAVVVKIGGPDPLTQIHDARLVVKDIIPKGSSVIISYENGTEDLFTPIGVLRKIPRAVEEAEKAEHAASAEEVREQEEKQRKAAEDREKRARK